MQGTIGAARSRVGMAVLTLTLMNGGDDIAAMTAGTLGCTGAELCLESLMVES